MSKISTSSAERFLFIRLNVMAVYLKRNFQKSQATPLFFLKQPVACGIFKELKNDSYFKHARISFGGIAWSKAQDFSADTVEMEMQVL